VFKSLLEIVTSAKFGKSNSKPHWKTSDKAFGSTSGRWRSTFPRVLGLLTQGGTKLQISVKSIFSPKILVFLDTNSAFVLHCGAGCNFSESLWHIAVDFPSRLLGSKWWSSSDMRCHRVPKLPSSKGDCRLSSFACPDSHQRILNFVDMQWSSRVIWNESYHQVPTFETNICEFCIISGFGSCSHDSTSHLTSPTSSLLPCLPTPQRSSSAPTLWLVTSNLEPIQTLDQLCSPLSASYLQFYNCVPDWFSYALALTNSFSSDIQIYYYMSHMVMYVEWTLIDYLKLCCTHSY